MLTMFQKIRDTLRAPYDPNPCRRAEVAGMLAGRPALSHEEWHARFAASRGIPVDFVQWFLDTCSDRYTRPKRVRIALTAERVSHGVGGSIHRFRRVQIPRQESINLRAGFLRQSCVDPVEGMAPGSVGIDFILELLSRGFQ